ncbi:unnamed protein product, partial [marine sediment metagenome]
MPWMGTFDSDRYAEIILDRTALKWPNPNTLRVDARYRMAIGEGLPDARPVRYFFKLNPYELDAFTIWGWFDVSIITENHFHG